jgi:hypothetical protein
MGSHEELSQDEEAKQPLKGMRILIPVLVVLAAVYGIVWLSERRGTGPDPLFPELGAETAAGIYIAASGKNVVLEKQDERWIVLSEDSLPADPTAVQAILDKVASFSRGDMVSSNPGKRSLYQVDSAGVFASIVGGKGDTLAAFVVGKVGPDYQSSYVRDAGSDDVILAPGYLRSMFDRGERPWQDRLIFSFGPDEITRVEIRRGKETYVLARQAGGEWYISEPDSAACKQDRASRLVRMLSLLRCDGFAGRLPLPGSGLAASDTTLWFATASGEEHRLLFGSENENGQVHLARDDSDVVYLLARPKVEQLFPALGDMLPEDPVPGEATE